MASITFKHKGESVTLDVALRGKPRNGESPEQARDRRVAAAKSEYKKANA